MTITGRMAISSVILGLCAVVTLLIAFGWKSRPVGATTRRRLLGIGAAVLLVALVLRAVMAQVGDGGAWDIGVAYRSFGHTLAQGGDVYGRFRVPLANYPPVVYWWFAIADNVAPVSVHLFAALARLPFWVLDAAVAPLLLAITPARWRVRAAWSYAFNPIAIAVPTLHGQFDSLPAIAVVLAVAWLRLRPRAAGFALGAGIALKPWPAFLLPLLLGTMRSRRRTLVIGAVAVPAAAFATYFAFHPQHVVDALVGVIFYNPHRQGFGTTFFFPQSWGSAINPFINLVILALIIQLGRVCHRRGIQATADIVLIGQLLLIGLSPSVTDNYLVWPIALLLFAGRLKMAAVLAAVMTPATVVIDILSQQGGYLAPVPAWLVLPVTFALWSCAARIWIDVEKNYSPGGNPRNLTGTSARGMQVA